MKKLVSLILFILIFISVIKNDSKLEEARGFPFIAEFQVKLVAVGDNLIHETVYQAAAIDDGFDFKPFFKEIKPFIKTFDLAFVNQETILGGKEIGLSTYPCFNSPYEIGDALVDAGFNLISIANNHTLDRGEKAVINAYNYWNNQDVIFSGAVLDEDEKQIKTFSKNGIDFAFVAYTYGTNGIKHPNNKFHLANIYSNSKAKSDVLSVKDDVDVIIVSMHWGEEYQSTPSKIQKQQALYLSSLGVDIIIGHHPHVIQPVDIIEIDNHKTFVIYSLGNFLSDQKGIDRLIGMAASIEINKKVVFGKTTIELKNPEAKLLYRYKDINNNLFFVKMFQDLNNAYLYDYEKYYHEKKDIIQMYYQDIVVS